MNPRPLRLATLTLLALLAFPALAATVREHTADGIAFIEGGIGAEDRQVLDAERDRYAVLVLTAARGSGAWLADVHVGIRDDAGKSVFERQLQAPWLLIDMPPGR